MLFNFFKKKPTVDPVIKEQLEQTYTRFADDLEAIQHRLKHEYPNAMSAIEDYRAGYLTDSQLEIRFSLEEIETIRVERDRRNEEDKELPTGGYL